MFVGKAYIANGHFKLNVMIVKPNNMNRVSTFTHLFEFSNLWHDETRALNYGSLRRLINLNHIPKF